MGEIPWCWYSNETYLVELLQSTIYFLRFYKTKFNFGGIFLARRLELKRFICQVYPEGGGVSVRAEQIIRGIEFRFEL